MFSNYKIILILILILILVSIFSYQQLKIKELNIDIINLEKQIIIQKSTISTIQTENNLLKNENNNHLKSISVLETQIEQEQNECINTLNDYINLNYILNNSSYDEDNSMKKSSKSSDEIVNDEIGKQLIKQRNDKIYKYYIE